VRLDGNGSQERRFDAGKGELGHMVSHILNAKTTFNGTDNYSLDNIITSRIKCLMASSAGQSPKGFGSPWHLCGTETLKTTSLRRSHQ